MESSEGTMKPKKDLYSILELLHVGVLLGLLIHIYF